MGKTMLQENLGKIALFRALQLGDMLCIIPSLRALRKRYPTTRITLIGLPWAKDFVKRFPLYCDDFIAFPGFPGLPESKANTSLFPKFLKRVQAEKFDLVLQLHGSGKVTNPLIELFNAKQTAGFYAKNTYCPNPQTFFLYQENVSEVEKFIYLLSKLSISPADTYLEFPLTEKETSSAKLLMKKYNLGNKKFIVIHPGARDKKRQNNIVIFTRIMRYLQEKGFSIVLTGTTPEKDITQEIIHSTSSEVINLCGKTSLGQLAFIIKASYLLMSNDTGVSHIADALHTPSIILFTSYSDPVQWAPLNKKLHVPLTPPHLFSKIIDTADSLLDTNRKNRGLLPRKDFYANN